MKNVCESEIKADILIKEVDMVRLWGQVKDCDGNPVCNVLLKLLKHENGCYSGIAHTISDCQGFYQFDLCSKDSKAHYKVIAGKSNIGSEKVVDISELNCTYCEKCTPNCTKRDCDNDKKCSHTCHCKHYTLHENCADTCKRDETCDTCKHYNLTEDKCAFKLN